MTDRHHHQSELGSKALVSSIHDLLLQDWHKAASKVSHKTSDGPSAKTSDGASSKSSNKTNDKSTHGHVDKLSGEASSKIGVDLLLPVFNLVDDKGRVHAAAAGVAGRANGKAEAGPAGKADGKAEAGPAGKAGGKALGGDVVPPDPEVKPDPEVPAAEAEVGVSLVRTKDTAPIEDGSFAKKSLAMFDRLDTDKNGFISDREATEAIQDNKYTDDDAQTVAGLYKGRATLSRLHDDTTMSDYAGIVSSSDNFRPGVSRADLEAYGAMQESRRQQLDKLGAASNYLKGDGLKKVDSDSDGQVTKQELAKRALNTTDEQELKALHYLVDNYDSIRGSGSLLGSAAINLDTMKAHVKNIEATTESQAVKEVSAGVYFTSQSQKPGVSYFLFASDDPLKSITPEAIQQRSIGDCYFEASLASLAKERPQDIAKMIKDNGDGTYTVTFPGAPNDPVTVKAPTEAELGVFNAASEHGTWANVIEKAFGQYRRAHSAAGWGDWALGRKDQTPTDGADGGGLTTEAMDLLSARPSTFHRSWWNSEDAIANDIKAAMAEKRMVTAGTPGVTDKERLDNGYPTCHAYSVVGYREDSKGQRFVTVRNPWGGTGKDGTSEVTIAEFKQTFNQYAIEDR